MNRRRGSAMIETAIFLPVLILLMVGTVEIARITYTYYTLHKMMYAVARYVTTQQGVNFCDNNDPEVANAKAFALGSPSILPALTADMINIRIEQADATGAITECSCSVPGCDTVNGGMPPDYVVVSIPDGYPVTPHIPFIPTDAIPLKPQIRMPYGGT